MKNPTSLFVDEFALKSLPLRFMLAALLTFIGLGVDLPWLSSHAKEIIFLRITIIIGALFCSYLCSCYSNRNLNEILIVLAALGAVSSMAMIGHMEQTYLSGYTAAVYQILAFIVIFLPLRTNVFLGLIIAIGVLWFFVFPRFLLISLDQRLFISHIFGYATYGLMSLAGNYLFFQVWNEKDRQRANLEAQSSQLKEIAYYDGLTGLYNYRQFMDSLQTYIEEAKYTERSFSLCLIDLDDFKLINDNHGHIAGNEVLQNVALCLASSMRSKDKIFRIGGDEFAAILPDVNCNDARKIIGRFKAKLNSMDRQDLITKAEVGCSVGISEITQDIATVNALIEAADRDLYKEKRFKKSKYKC